MTAPTPEPTPESAPAAPDPRPQLARATAQMAEVFATVPELGKEVLDGPTPCGEYDVRALLAHIVDGTHRMAEIGETGTEGEADPDPDPEGGWSAAYEAARERFTAAWAEDAKLDRLVTVPWGTMPGRIALAGTVLEVVTHSWDLARSLGYRGELDQDLAEFALRAAHQALPAERRGEGVPFGPVREAPAGSDAYGRLAAWLGRPADWTA